MEKVTKMPKIYYTKYGPMLIVFVFGLVLTIGYLSSDPAVQNIERNISNLATIVVAYSSIVGLIVMIRRHTFFAMKSSIDMKMRVLSVWRICLSLIVVISGIAQGVNGPIFTWIYQNIILPPRTSIYVLYIFSFTYAIYRGLKMRSLDSTAFGLAAITMILVNTPIAIINIPGLKFLGEWLLNTGLVVGMRATSIGVGVGVTITGIRIILGRQMGIFVEGEEGEI